MFTFIATTRRKALRLRYLTDLKCACTICACPEDRHVLELRDLDDLVSPVSSNMNIGACRMLFGCDIVLCLCLRSVAGLYTPMFKRLCSILADCDDVLSRCMPCRAKLANWPGFLPTSSQNFSSTSRRVSAWN